MSFKPNKYVMKALKAEVLILDKNDLRNGVYRYHNIGDFKPEVKPAFDSAQVVIYRDSFETILLKS